MTQATMTMSTRSRRICWGGRSAKRRLRYSSTSPPPPSGASAAPWPPSSVDDPGDDDDVDEIAEDLLGRAVREEAAQVLEHEPTSSLRRLRSALATELGR